MEKKYRLCLEKIQAMSECHELLLYKWRLDPEIINLLTAAVSQHDAWHIVSKWRWWWWRWPPRSSSISVPSVRLLSQRVRQFCLILQSVLPIGYFNASNASQLGCSYQVVYVEVSGASVFLDKYLQTFILYENKPEYVKVYDSNAWVNQICHSRTHIDFLWLFSLII